MEDDSGEEESDMEVFESLPHNSHFSNLDAGWLTTAWCKCFCFFFVFD